MIGGGVKYEKSKSGQSFKNMFWKIGIGKN